VIDRLRVVIAIPEFPISGIPEFPDFFTYRNSGTLATRFPEFLK